jgi:hypothetical protein
MKKHTRLCSHCQRERCVLDDDEEFTVNGIPYRKVPPGVYEVPVGALGEFSIGQLPPHSSIHVTDLPPPPPDHEFCLSVTNGGDANDDQYLTILAEVYLASDEHRQAKLAQIRRAYLALVERGELPAAFIPPGTRDHPNLGASFSIDLAGHSESVIRDQIQPILQLFKRINMPA